MPTLTTRITGLKIQLSGCLLRTAGSYSGCSRRLSRLPFGQESIRCVTIAPSRVSIKLLTEGRLRYPGLESRVKRDFLRIGMPSNECRLTKLSFKFSYPLLHSANLWEISKPVGQ